MHIEIRTEELQGIRRYLLLACILLFALGQLLNKALLSFCLADPLCPSVIGSLCLQLAVCSQLLRKEDFSSASDRVGNVLIDAIQ